jgi:hypothetical protein
MWVGPRWDMDAVPRRRWQCRRRWSLRTARHGRAFQVAKDLVDGGVWKIGDRHTGAKRHEHSTRRHGLCKRGQNGRLAYASIAFEDDSGRITPRRVDKMRFEQAELSVASLEVPARRTPNHPRTIPEAIPRNWQD